MIENLTSQDTQGGPSTLPCNPPRNNIFYHEDHDMGLRFHIQKDLRESLIRMLAGEITVSLCLLQVVSVFFAYVFPHEPAPRRANYYQGPTQRIRSPGFK